MAAVRDASSRALQMAGRVPVVPFYPSKNTSVRLSVFYEHAILNYFNYSALDKASKDYQWMDIYNALGRTRTLFVGRFLDDESCNQLIASLLWLESQNSKAICMYVIEYVNML